MARLGRKGRILKWAGAVVSSLIAMMWTASLFWAGWYRSAVRETADEWFVWVVDIEGGKLDLGCGLTSPYFAAGVFVPNLDHDLDHSGHWFGVRLKERREWTYITWMPDDPYTGTERTRQGRPLPWAVVMPLWIPFVLVAVPTAYLWWRDRRRIPPGHCRNCGYNLTGNVSGTCPECGQTILAASKAAG